MDLWPRLHSSGTGDEKEPPLDVSTPYSCSVCHDAAALEVQVTDVVCRRCGTVVDVPLERGAEYRWYSGDAAGPGTSGDPSRCSFPVNSLMPESSLATIILDTAKNPLMRKMRRYHMWSIMPSREKTLWRILETLQIRATNAGISASVVDEAKELFAQLTATATCRGPAQRDAMLAACIWEALKRQGASRLPRDIAEIFAIPLKHVTRGIKLFNSLLAFRASGAQTDTYAVPSSDEGPRARGTEGGGESESEGTQRALQRQVHWQTKVTHTISFNDFVVPFLSNLSLPQLEPVVRQVCERIDDLGIVPENTPPSLTASVIAFCAAEYGFPLDVAEIARVCGISTVTILKCVKRLEQAKKNLLDQ